MKSLSDGEEWFPYNDRRSTNPQIRMRLFCFPYAGGRAAEYYPWRSAFPPQIEVVPVELPGRGRRLATPPLRRLTPLLSSLLPAIERWLDKPFALFGHSMGGIISLELAHLLRETPTSGPAHLLVSGCRAPHMRDKRPPTHDLSDDAFIQYLRRLNGTPEEVFQTPELLDLLLPILRADLELYETYRYETETRAPLACPITVYGGRQDALVNQEQLAGWRGYTTGCFTRRIFTGGHFYFRTNKTALLTNMVQRLLPANDQSA